MDVRLQRYLWANVGNEKRPTRLCRSFSLARPKEFESPTFRLGGGRSILLSYGRIFYTIVYLYFMRLSMG